MWGNPTLGYLGDLRTRVFQQFCLVGWSLKSNSLAWLQDTPFGPRMPKRHQLVTDIGEVPVMEKMQDPKMCWAFLFPGHGVVVAVYPSHALISLQWYGSYPGFKRVILLHRSMIFPGIAARQRASDSSFIYPCRSKSSLNYAFAKGLVKLGL